MCRTKVREKLDQRVTEVEERVGVLNPVGDIKLV